MNQDAHRVVRLHPAAPAKPARGAACNGCGVCCAAEPCPLGMLASRRRHGACAALLWAEADGRYRCGLVARPAAYLPTPLHRAGPLLARVASRCIAAGAGCDATWQVETPVAGPPSDLTPPPSTP